MPKRTAAPNPARPHKKRGMGSPKSETERALAREARRQKFFILAMKRGATVIKDLALVKKLANKKYYEFDAVIVDELFAKIRADVDDAERKFRNALAGAKEPVFEFAGLKSMRSAAAS